MVLNIFILLLPKRQAPRAWLREESETFLKQLENNLKQILD